MNTHAGDFCNLSRNVPEDRPGGGIAADGLSVDRMSIDTLSVDTMSADAINAEEIVVGGMTEEDM